jgi:hypothetical protein
MLRGHEEADRVARLGYALGDGADTLALSESLPRRLPPGPRFHLCASYDKLTHARAVRNLCFARRSVNLSLAPITRCRCQGWWCLLKPSIDAMNLHL